MAALIAGCNSSPYELAPARGTVTIDGEPLTAGRVMFAPTARSGSNEAGKPAFGTIQPDGSFTLTTYTNGDGAIVGEHWVTIFGPKKTEAATAASKFTRFAVPRKQSIVAGQGNKIDLQISSQEIARFAIRGD